MIKPLHLSLCASRALASLQATLSKKVVFLIVLVTTIITLMLHLFLLNSEIGNDEAFYAAAAETILNHTSCGPLVDLVSLQPCNLEHPPLAKLLMAASIFAFGNDNLGVRLPSIFAGVLSVPVISWLTWRLSKRNPMVTIASAILLSTSPVFFLLSSVGMLDSIEVFFGLLAFAVYFSGNDSKSPRLAIAAGVVMGLSVLSKEAAVYLFVGFVSYLLIFERRKDAIYLSIVTAATVLLGIWAYDAAFTPFGNPFQHIAFIFETDLRLRYQGGYAVTPLMWFFQDREIVLSSLSFIWGPIAVTAMARTRKASAGVMPFSLLLLSTSLVPLALLFYIDQRQEFLFYFLQVLPALVLGCSGLFGLRRIPSMALLALAAISIALFVYYLPSANSVYF